MGTKNVQKLKLLYILEMFMSETDESHPIRSDEIISYLSTKGITAERKSIYNDISVLEDYGYDIIKVGGASGGWFLGSRDFELAELRLLSDAVQAANFISPKKTKQLLNKILKLASRRQAEKIKKQVYVENRPKCGNEELYYTIDKLSRAIQSKKMACIVYRKRIINDQNQAEFEEKSHIVSPYSLVWSNDHYYLISNNNGYDNLMVTRIDRIRHVEILENEKSRPFSEVSPYRSSFDSADYVNKHFNMFSGEPKPIKLICANEVIDRILDKFGEKAKICKNDEDTFILHTDAAISEGFVSWIMQFGGLVCVKSPSELKNMVLTRAEEIIKAYNK